MQRGVGRTAREHAAVVWAHRANKTSWRCTPTVVAGNSKAAPASGCMHQMQAWFARSSHVQQPCSSFDLGCVLLRGKTERGATVLEGGESS